MYIPKNADLSQCLSDQIIHIVSKCHECRLKRIEQLEHKKVQVLHLSRQLLQRTEASLDVDPLPDENSLRHIHTIKCNIECKHQPLRHDHVG